VTAEFIRRFVLRLARGRPMGLGASMFVLHRLTGVGLTVYVFIHLVTLGSALGGPAEFDRVMAVLDGPSVRFLELLLVGAVLFHTFNGLRLVVVALTPRADQKWLAYAVVGLSLIGVLASAPLLLR
jgi:succinate dehydrogenase / fumarate reductase cytochrome b subunit